MLSAFILNSCERTGLQYVLVHMYIYSMKCHVTDMGVPYVLYIELDLVQAQSVLHSVL